MSSHSASGFRIPLSTSPPTLFPPPSRAGEPPTHDADGAPVFVGSALAPEAAPRAVIPCKIVPNLGVAGGSTCAVRVPYGGEELGHAGRYDLLPITGDMEWVPASGGWTPDGRRPVEGGYEEDGRLLYHGLADIDGVRVPGKVGEHLVRIKG